MDYPSNNCHLWPTMISVDPKDLGEEKKAPVNCGLLTKARRGDMENLDETVENSDLWT